MTRAYLTYFLIALCVVVFVCQSLVFTTPEGLEGFFNECGFSAANALTNPWTLVTSIFIHGDIVHLLANMIVLYFFGVAVEDEIGRKRMLLIFLGGAFLGDALSLLYYSWSMVGVGASAGIFALIGVGTILRPFDFSLPNPIPLGLMGIAYAFYNIVGFLSPEPSNIAYIAHFGGLIVGLLYGFVARGWKGGFIIVAVLSIIFIALLLLVPLLLNAVFTGAL